MLIVIVNGNLKNITYLLHKVTMTIISTIITTPARTVITEIRLPASVQTEDWSIAFLSKCQALLPVCYSLLSYYVHAFYIASVTCINVCTRLSDYNGTWYEHTFLTCTKLNNWQKIIVSTSGYV